MTSTPVTRGFLFADLRGYTAFVERHGNVAAAQLLERFRAIVREQVAHYDGAEIRTEGDSFYVVFPSASLAVRCALAIGEDVRAANADSPERRIDVGMGINAGETVDTNEGPIGSAVNLAARVAAQARAGEVLVTDTVRHIVMGNEELSFQQRGNQRLKGISEPIALFAVTNAAAGATTARTRRSWRWAAGVALLGVVFVGAAMFAFVATGWFRSPASSPAANSGSPTPPPTQATIAARTAGPDDPEGMVPLAAGRYGLSVFRPRVDFTMPEDGWVIAAEDTDSFELARGQTHDDLDAYIDGQQVQVVFDPPCPVGRTKLLDGTPRALIQALQENEYVTVGDPRPLNFAGYTGLQADVTYKKPLGDACGPFPDDLSDDQKLLLHMFPIGNHGTWKLSPGERVRLLSIDAEGTPLTIIVGTYDRALSKFEEIAQPIVESIEVAP